MMQRFSFYQPPTTFFTPATTGIFPVWSPVLFLLTFRLLFAPYTFCYPLFVLSH
jgi:hypothetical protein